jgi:hypothetical protein
MQHRLWLLLSAILFWGYNAIGADTNPENLMRLSEQLKKFASLPSCGLGSALCYPTPNARLDQEDEGFAAKSRTNEKYGLPGWTRGQGARFHKGVDILPINFEKSDKTVRIEYYDAKRDRSFAKYEPVLMPKDEIYSILDGVVVMANSDEQRSGYGRYLMVRHAFKDGASFVSMYAHLDRLEVAKGDFVQLGDRIAWMGRTSSSSEGRNYLRAIPHCHFEVGRIINQSFMKTLIAKRLNPPMLGGNYDPRNIQPYDPVRFLRNYKAQSRDSLTQQDQQEPPKE